MITKNSISFQTYQFFNNIQIKEAIDFTILKGVKNLEFFFKLYPNKIDNDLINHIINMKKKYNLYYQYHAPIPSFDENYKELILDIIDFAINIDAKVIVIHRYNIEEYFSYGWQDLVYKAFTKAKEHNILIGIENTILANNNFTFDSPEIVLQTISKFLDYDNVGITFDCGHANIHSKADDYLKTLITRLKIKNKKIVNVHIHDNLGDKDSHMPTGKGTINFKNIISILNDFDYNGKLVIENWQYSEYIKEYLENIINNIKH